MSKNIIFWRRDSAKVDKLLEGVKYYTAWHGWRGCYLHLAKYPLPVKSHFCWVELLWHSASSRHSMYTVHGNYWGQFCYFIAQRMHVCSVKPCPIFPDLWPSYWKKWSLKRVKMEHLLQNMDGWIKLSFILSIGIICSIYWLFFFIRWPHVSLKIFGGIVVALWVPIIGKKELIPPRRAHNSEDFEI